MRKKPFENDTNKFPKDEKINEMAYMESADNFAPSPFYEEPKYPNVNYPEGGGSETRRILKEELAEVSAPKTKAELKAEKKEALLRAKEEKKAIKEAKRQAKLESKKKHVGLGQKIHEMNEERKQKKEYYKEHKDEIKAEKRIAKEERKKAKAILREDKKLAKKAKKEDKKLLKESLKAERKAEKIAHKEHVRLEKQARKAHKEELKHLKKTDKSAYKAQILAEKQAKKAEKRARIEEKKRYLDEMRQKGFHVGMSKGLVAAVIVLAITTGLMTLGAGVLAGTTSHYMNMTENAYNKAYYQLIMDMNNMETSLSKVMVANSNAGQERMLNEVSALALSAENNLASLPTNSPDVLEVSKFFNMIMDYTKFLSNKVADGKKLTAEEQDTLEKLYNTNTTLKDAINTSFEESMQKNERVFSKGLFLRGQMIDPISIGINSVSDSSIEYPVLIYDGPFSDSKEEAESKLGANGISESQARASANKLMREMTQMELLGEVENRNVLAYSFKGMTKDREIYVQVSKADGTVIMVDAYRSVKNQSIDMNQAIESAKKVLNELNYTNVDVVWKATSGNVVTLNFASKEGNAVNYSRLVKVKVALDNGEVLGLEGLNYVVNTNSNISTKAKLSAEQAKAKVSEKLTIQQQRLTIIPKNKTNILAYEFAGTYNGMTFYVYIDANTGAEVNTLRVIENDEGQLVL